MSDGMGRELAYLSSHATNRYFIPNWGKILSVVVGSTRREVVSIHSRELQSARAQRDVMVELLVGALSIGATPQAECCMTIGESIAKVGKYKATVSHFHTSPQMVVLQVGSKVDLCRSRQA